MKKRLFTSESVTEGHPDKICDQISDHILDAILAQDSNARVACETVVTTGVVMVVGEITTSAIVNIEQIVRDTLVEIGYTDSRIGFDGNTCSVLVSVHTQSADIAQGVDCALESKEGQTSQLGAGDQGMMFGFACDETPELMPLPISLAHKLTKRLATVRKDGTLSYLRPDGKSQVTVEYENEIPKRVDTVVLSTQHSADIDYKTLKEDILNEVIFKSIDASLLDENTKYYINPTGRFVIGGPMGDSGLTGRKIIVDTYGGYAAHGGGAFSGKDATKVDRSACYAARYLAKNIVASHIASKCEVQLAYAIGVAQPVSILVNTYGTSKVSDEILVQTIFENFDLSPSSIINMFSLTSPIYKQTASYGHFGRTDIDLPWEKTDRTSIFKNL